MGVADWESVSVHSDLDKSLGQDATQMHGLNSKCVLRTDPLSLPLLRPPLCCLAVPSCTAAPFVWQAFALHQVHRGSGAEQQGVYRSVGSPQRKVSLLPAAGSALLCLRPPPCRSSTSK